MTTFRALRIHAVDDRSAAGPDGLAGQVSGRTLVRIG